MAEKVIIGDAELYHGDYRDMIDDLGIVDCIITDPPYGHNNNNDGDLIHRREKALGIAGKHAEARPIANDGAEAGKLFNDLMIRIPNHLDDGVVCCCCCGGGGPDPQFASWTIEMVKHLQFKHMVVWDKGPIGMGWHYRRSYEVVLIGHRKGKKCKWYDKTQKVENIIRPGGIVSKIIPTSEDHPTPKPPQLAQHFARLHTKAGDVVFDPFMGAGWVGVGVVPMGRRFIGVEIEKRWFDMACSRLDACQKQRALF